MNSIDDKDKLFAALAADAAACRRCESMCGRTAVLSERNGSVAARVMFIGEAPGRQGGDRTRVPFSGDQSGHNFGRYIASINLSRADIFITNSVLCNPRKESGANRKPSVLESLNCASFLQRQIELVAPRVVVTLGAVALAALKRIEYHQFSLKDSAGRVGEWNGRLLVPLYHPSPQVLASHRREDAQLQDYAAVARAIRQSAETARAGAREAH
ncbi:MAG TPA: uracil-DNA glycosylase [Pyrinomonadaceae bacterium]|jgi:DNA polymerase|nr:uracil-DNA glycosylase [Pyrinomonadaceae bacterium]